MIWLPAIQGHGVDMINHPLPSRVAHRLWMVKVLTASSMDEQANDHVTMRNVSEQSCPGFV